MKTFLLLLKTQLLATLSVGRANSSRRKGAVRASSLAGFGLVWLLMAALAAFYEFMYATMLVGGDAIDVLPVLIVTVSSFMTLLSSVTYTKSLIFCSRDYDLVFSLPVKGSTVVAAKIAALYILDLSVTLAMLLPCGVIWGMFAAPPVYAWVLFFVMALLVPLVPILLASLISALISMFASRFRHAKIVSTILSVALFVALMVGIYSMNGTEDAEIAAMLSGLAANLCKYYLPVAWFSAALTGGVSDILLFFGVSILSFAVIALVFGRFYGKIHEMFRVRTFRRAYKASSASSGVLGALMKKDIKRLFSSPGLMLNQITGVLMAVIFTVMFSIQGGKFDISGEDAAEFSKIFSMMYPYLLAMCASMACLTNCSISLEGKTMGLIKSLPVPAKTILRGKLAVHMVLCFPVLAVCSVVLAVVFRFDPVNALIMVALPLLYSYNAGVSGLLLNLRKYNFNWTNEVMVAKNSMPVVVTIFGGMAAALFPMFLAFALVMIGIPSAVVSGSICVLALILSVVLTMILNKKGESRFRAIES